MIRLARDRSLSALLFCAAGLAACSYPNTDITAINTERVGNYRVVRATGTDALTADVCVAEPSHVDAISARLIQQLANHGHRTIMLNMYGPNGAIARFEWNGRDVRRQNVSTTTAPVSCGPNSGETSARR